jgi:raffinose/stachyose/melibiose transport system substrate-binding protein
MSGKRSTPGSTRQDGAADDVSPLDGFLERSYTRADALRGFGGVVAATTLGGLASASPAFARRSGSTTTITMWANHPEWKSVLDAMIGDFEKAYPSIKVEIVYKADEAYQGALNTALAGGAAPDVIGWVEGTSIRTGASDKQIIPLDGKVHVNALTAAAKPEVVFDGHVWGVPLAAYTVGIFYQVPVFKKYGLKPPTTWAEMTAIASQLKSKGVTPWSMPAKDGIIPFFFYTMAVSSILGTNGFADLRRGTVKLTDAKLIPAAELMVDYEPYYNAGYQAVDYAEGKALFAQGETAMIIGGSADYTGYKQVNPNVDVAVFGFPSPNGKSHITVTGMELLYSVNAKSANQAAATTFVSWLASDKAQQLIGDNIALPVVNGVVPSSNNPIAREMVMASDPALPVWIDLPELTNVLNAVTEAGGIFTGSLSATQFAKKVQASITPNPKA